MKVLGRRAKRKVEVSIGKKLFYIFLIPIFSLIVTSYISVRSLNRLHYETKEKVGRGMVEVEQTLLLKNLVTIYRQKEYEYILREKKYEKNRIETYELLPLKDNINLILIQLSQTSYEDFNKVKALWEGYYKSSLKLVNLSKEGKAEEAKNRLLILSTSDYNRLLGMIESLDSYRSEEQKKTFEGNEQFYQKTVAQLSAISALMILGVVVILLIFSRKLSKPIKVLGRELSDLSQRGGDLTRKIEITSKDEVAHLSQEFNNFIYSLRDIISKVKRISKEVSHRNDTFASSLDNIVKGGDGEVEDGVLQLQQYVERVLTRIQDQSSSTEEIVASIEEMTATAELMNQNSMGIVAGTTSIAEEVAESKETVRELLNGMEIIEKSVENANGQIEELYDLSSGIENILTSIKGISEQTNLLALNAAIEAARAGEAGKGFAVVAGAIRELAEESNKETNKIVEIILNIHNRVNLVKEANSEVAENVKNGYELNRKMNEKLEKVLENTMENKERINEMAVSINEQRIGTSEITEALSLVNESILEIQESEEKNHRISESIVTVLHKKLDEIDELSSSIRELDTEMMKFTT